MDIKIKMLKTVTPEPSFLYSNKVKGGEYLKEGEIYSADANTFGALCGICDNGEKLGVKPNEFIFIEAPAWILNLWLPNRTQISALKILEKEGFEWQTKI